MAGMPREATMSARFASATLLSAALISHSLSPSNEADLLIEQQQPCCTKRIIPVSRTVDQKHVVSTTNTRPHRSQEILEPLVVLKLVAREDPDDVSFGKGNL